jgi:hypothetical protein
VPVCEANRCATARERGGRPVGFSRSTTHHAERYATDIIVENMQMIGSRPWRFVRESWKQMHY